MGGETDKNEDLESVSSQKMSRGSSRVSKMNATRQTSGIGQKRNVQKGVSFANRGGNGESPSSNRNEGKRTGTIEEVEDESDGPKMKKQGTMMRQDNKSPMERKKTLGQMGKT